MQYATQHTQRIVALRNEKGSYNRLPAVRYLPHIVALRNEKGSYNYRSSSFT